MMGFRDTCIAGFLALIGTPILLGSISLATAQVMSSTNYQIQQDSINFGGGLSASGNYIIESTGGEIATGDRSSGSYNLRGGYQQLDTSFISLSSVDPVIMTPSLAGITGGVSNGSTTVITTTDSPAGYELTIASTEAPAMQSAADTIDDYVPSGDPDFTFTTDPGDSHFGYSPSGTDIAGRFQDDGAACNTGSGDTALACWDGLDTTDEVIARSTGPNVPSGTETTLYFRIGIGASAFQTSGTYTATTTVTAIAL